MGRVVLGAPPPTPTIIKRTKTITHTTEPPRLSWAERQAIRNRRKVQAPKRKLKGRALNLSLKSSKEPVGRELDFDPEVEVWVLKMWHTNGVDLTVLARCCKTTTQQVQLMLREANE